jgi:hypothetical protein
MWKFVVIRFELRNPADTIYISGGRRFKDMWDQHINVNQRRVRK